MSVLHRVFRGLAVLVAAGVIFAASSACAGNIVDEWSGVKPPPAPELKPVTADIKTTALLMLDFLPSNCGVRPRCTATLPAMKKLLEEARAKGVTVMHSLAGNFTTADILKEVAPAANEPWVKSAADKFFRSDLEKMLAEKGIKTVIVVGTAANGAVLYTGYGAAIRGLKVIVAVDGISSSDAYAEQLAVWQLLNGPGSAGNVVATRSDLIKF